MNVKAVTKYVVKHYAILAQWDDFLIGGGDQILPLGFLKSWLQPWLVASYTHVAFREMIHISFHSRGLS